MTDRDGAPRCDYCDGELGDTPFPAFVERGVLIFRRTEVMLFCSRRHALLWAREAT